MAEKDNNGKQDDIQEEKNQADQIKNEIVTEEVVDPNIGTLKPRDLIEEMKVSYLDYAMSVIVSRALPDVRDGLKPVHRRVLYAMYSTGLYHTAKYRKSAKVVGEVMGNYHPHSDTAIYDTLVRLAQDFSMRYQMVDGQGNFGSMDGDSAAAMRYTECRMSALASEMLLDIDKDTVDWQDNYDGTKQEPIVLPSRVPQLLLNGSMGIAVGMATNIPPHNLGELCDGVNHLISNPEATVEDLMEYVKGPDFPTGGIIYNIEDIKAAYATGKSKIIMRAKAEIEEIKRGFRIIVTEMPYQVNKSALIEKIAELVKDKRIDGIYDIRDESDRTGVRVVIELRSSAYPQKVLNRLFELTPLQTAFHVNMLALSPDLEPRVMTLKDILSYYIEHRQEVLTRRTGFELKKAKDRAHILEGLKIALLNIDRVVEVIKKSQSRETAKANLKAEFKLSEVQANAILDMRLSALAALERQKVEDEYKEILARIGQLEDLLSHPEKILNLIKKDLNEVKSKYNDERRTEIIPNALGQFSARDLIPNQQVIVSLSRGDYIKRQDENTYRKQIRGGKGVIGMTTKEEDIVEYLSCCHTHDDIYFFSNKGRVFKSKVYELPGTSRQSRGTPVVNIIQIGQDEKVTSVLTVSEKSSKNKYFVMGTRKGMIKRTEIAKYNNIRNSGILAMGLDKEDELKWVKVSNSFDAVVEVTEKGLSISFLETEIRPMGRSASGVRGIKVRQGDNVMSMDVVSGQYVNAFDERAKQMGIDMFIVLENGFGKRTLLKNFHLQKRGGMGIRAANCTARTGNVIGMRITYSDEGDIVLASKKGQFIRVALKDIKRLGRDTQGVTLMRLDKDDKVASVALILPDKGEKTDIDIKEDLTTKIKPPEKNQKIEEKKPQNDLKKPIDSESSEIMKEEKVPTITKKADVGIPTEDPKGSPWDVGKEKPDANETDESLQNLQFKINTYKDKPKTDEFERSNFTEPKENHNKDETNYWGAQKKL